MATDTDQQVEALSRSSFSIEDWDRPTTPKANGVANGARRLAELLQKHAEDGKAVELTPEDEAKLSEELAAWVRCLVVVAPIMLCLYSLNSPCSLDQRTR